ncbi:MAG: aldehyde dehydrogenase family protein, partial [Wenzhouxiangella sp.]|nr:aldehyde dehydrogenase family protein [Wenzhouxiangella sp.]
MSKQQILDQLGLKNINPGACFGPGQWSTIEEKNLIESINPTTGQSIARVGGASAADYDKVIQTAQEAAAAWKTVPAPIRGEAVRLVTAALRDYKDP